MRRCREKRPVARYLGRLLPPARRASRRPKKKPGTKAGFKGRDRAVSGRCLDVRCLFAFRALHDLEGHLLTFLEGFEPIHLDGREVCKQILTTLVRRDESETFCVIEPFDRTSCHSNFPCNSCHYHEPSKSSSTARC